MLYAAYGSNLNPRQMRVRCPGAQWVGGILLPKGRLVFRGVADIVADDTASCPVGVWRIGSHHERELDRFEGVKRGIYRKKYLKLRIKGGVSEPCLIYQMRHKGGVQPPTEDYFATILEGYRWAKLEEKYLHDALHRSWADKNVTPFLQERAEAKGWPKRKQSERHDRKRRRK